MEIKTLIYFTIYEYNAIIKEDNVKRVKEEKKNKNEKKERENKKNIQSDCGNTTVKTFLWE